MQDSSRNAKDAFSNYFKTWSENYPIAEMFDFDKYIAANKLNTKALSEAAKTIAEGAQAVARRQAQILQKNAEDVVKFFRDVAPSARNPEVNMSKQADFARASMESVIEDSRELFEITSQYNNEANEIIGRRVSDALADLTARTERGRASNDSSSRRSAHEPAREAARAGHKKTEPA